MSSKQQSLDKENISCYPVFLKTIFHFFPALGVWLKGVKDPRNPSKITYQIETLLYMGIFLFLFKLASRRALKFTFARALSLENLKPFLNIDKTPHGDTLAYLLERLSYIELEWVKTFMIRRLLRMKCFTNFRLLGYYLVAADGTRVPSGCYTFSQRHCQHCLTRTLKDGTTQYYHYVLEAKLILGNGMAISMATEFVENPQSNPTKWSTMVLQCSINRIAN